MSQSIICDLCGCPEDDAEVNEYGEVSCHCGIDTEGFDPDDLAFGFHITVLDDEDLEPFPYDPFPEEG